MLTFRLRLEPSSEQSVESPFAAQFRGEWDVVAVADQLSHIYNILIRPETERQTAIRQTVPTKAPVEAETSTLINKRLFIKEFHFE